MRSAVHQGTMPAPTEQPVSVISTTPPSRRSNYSVALPGLRSWQSDAHHGDGTQQIFYNWGDVLTISIHGDPTNYYPFYTGYIGEVGLGEGRGCNLNLPLSPGSDGAAMTAAIDTASRRLQAFGAEALIVAFVRRHAKPLRWRHQEPSHPA